MNVKSSNRARAMTIKKLCILLGLAVGLVSADAAAQASPSAFTMGTRYDLAGRVTGVIGPDPDGAGALKYAAIRNTYNAYGNLTKIETGELSSWQSDSIAPASWTGFTVRRVQTISYDSRGRKTKETIASGATTYAVKQFSYDVYERVQCETVRMDPAVFGSLPADACSSGAAGSFGDSRVTRYTYDYLDRVTKIEKAVGTPLLQDYVTYALTAAGDPKTVTDANGNMARMDYDGFGRLTRWNFPSKTTAGQVNTADYEEYGYDANDNRTSLRKRDAQVINFTYDNLNRATKKDVLGTASDVYYGYDLRNLELFARFGSTSGEGITTAYDGFGRIASSTLNMGGVSRTLSYQYDAGSNRTRVTHPDGQYFTYVYDGLDRATEIYENGATLLATLVYNTDGKRSAFNRTGGANTTYAYDPVSRLSSLAQDLAGTADDVTYSFTYNPASQIVTRAISKNAFIYSGTGSVTGAYAVNGLNQYTSAGGAAYSYDPNGNLTSDGSVTYAYDVENRLVSASGAKSATLKYDPHGRLYETVGGGATTRFLYDGDALIAEYDGTGALLRRYAHGPGVDEPVLWYEGSGVSSANRRYLHADHQGSVIAVTDANAAVPARNTYDAYGAPGATNIGRFAYTGQIEIPELGLYHYKARIYSATIGRFLQTDPIGYDDQMNLYAYVYNDPVNVTDPTGECPWCIGAAVGAVVGAAFEAGSQLARGEKLDGGKVFVAAAVGAATGAVGPAGGAALRTALVGKAAAAAASKGATPAARALVVATDLAADAVGQPAIGATEAALSGNDPGVGALSGAAAAGTGAGFDAATNPGKPDTKVGAGVRGGAVSLAKSVAKAALTSVASKATQSAADRRTDAQTRDRDIED